MAINPTYLTKYQNKKVVKIITNGDSFNSVNINIIMINRLSISDAPDNSLFASNRIKRSELKRIQMLVMLALICIEL
jgi:hypothetical protein